MRSCPGRRALPSPQKEQGPILNTICSRVHPGITEASFCGQRHSAVELQHAKSAWVQQQLLIDQSTHEKIAQMNMGQKQLL